MSPSFDNADPHPVRFQCDKEDCDYEEDAVTDSEDDWADLQWEEVPPPASTEEMDIDEEPSKSDLVPIVYSDTYADLVDPSQYKQIAFVARSDSSKKPTSIVQLQYELQKLTYLWEAFSLPTSQQCMKFKETSYGDIYLYRHARTSLEHHERLDKHSPGFGQLSKILMSEDTAVVVSGLEGITRDQEELSRYLKTFKHSTTLYFLHEGNFRRRYRSRDLAYQLAFYNSLSQEDIILEMSMHLHVMKNLQIQAEMSWAIAHLPHATGFFEQGRPLTSRMVQTLSTLTSDYFGTKPSAFRAFTERFALARQKFEEKFCQRHRCQAYYDRALAVFEKMLEKAIEDFIVNETPLPSRIGEIVSNLSNVIIR